MQWVTVQLKKNGLDSLQGFRHVRSINYETPDTTKVPNGVSEKLVECTDWSMQLHGLNLAERMDCLGVEAAALVNIVEPLKNIRIVASCRCRCCCCCCCCCCLFEWLAVAHLVQQGVEVLLLARLLVLGLNLFDEVLDGRLGRWRGRGLVLGARRTLAQNVAQSTGNNVLDLLAVLVQGWIVPSTTKKMEDVIT